jgi:hypothetical protein
MQTRRFSTLSKDHLGAPLAARAAPLPIHCLLRGTGYHGTPQQLVHAVFDALDCGPVGAPRRPALTRIAAFFTQLRKTAEQLTALERLYRILSQALKKFLRRRNSSRRSLPAGAASYS